MPLPSGPGQIISVDYFGPLPITRQGNKHILLYTDRFSRHIAAYAVTQDERTAEGTARIFVEQYIPLWGCPHTLLSDNGTEFVARLSLAIYKLMKVRKIATTAFHPKSNGGVERVNHSLAQMLSLVISEQQDDWDEWLPYVVQAYNNSVSAATGLAPNEIHLGRMPRLPITAIDECVVKGHTGERQDQLLYLDIVRERQQRAFELVQESHLIAMSKIQRSNTKLLAILHKLPNFEVGNWVWTYNRQATIGRGGGEDSSQIVTKLSLNWTGPYKILVVGPGLGPDGRPVADKTLYLDLPTDMPGKDQKKRVSVDRCKMCHNPSDDLDIPKYLPAGLSKYVLHSFTDKSPPFHPTTEDVAKSGIPVDIEKITGHQLVRGRGGKLAVMYETHWEGLSSITWEREIDLRNFSRYILEYWMSTPRQVKGVNSKYRAMRRAQAHRAYWRHQNKYYLEQGYHLVSYSTWEKKFRRRRVPLRAFFWWKTHQGWWLGQVKAWDRDIYDQYFVRFHDDPGLSQVMLVEEFYTTDVDGVPGS